MCLLSKDTLGKVRPQGQALRSMGEGQGRHRVRLGSAALPTVLTLLPSSLDLRCTVTKFIPLPLQATVEPWRGHACRGASPQCLELGNLLAAFVALGGVRQEGAGVAKGALAGLACGGTGFQVGRRAGGLTGMQQAATLQQEPARPGRRPVSARMEMSARRAALPQDPIWGVRCYN